VVVGVLVGVVVGEFVGVLVAAAHTTLQHGSVQLAVPHSGPESHTVPGSPPLYTLQSVGVHRPKALAC
jgi:hypothetical protein